MMHKTLTQIKAGVCSNAEYAIMHHENKNMGDIMKSRLKLKPMTFFEMRSALVGPGLRYAYRMSEDYAEWLTYFDTRRMQYRKTDFFDGEDWTPTVEDVTATDWIVYIFE